MAVAKLDWRNWKRVLVVVAHPDDAEYGLSGAVQLWTRHGIEVDYLLLTHGEAGMQCSPEEAAALRAREQRAACDCVGVNELVMLRYPDGHLMPSIELRRDIARQIRRLKPDVVITANYEQEAYGTLNQSDHRVAGVAALDAARDAANRWSHRELLEVEGHEPHTADLLLVAAPSDPTHVVEVDDEAVAAAIASLACHEAYLGDLVDYPTPTEVVNFALSAAAEFSEVERGVSFRVFGLGGQPEVMP
ncbi:1D-myo-inositol 2-acetamido-2-deoxy-alpha-D-glucopyranoside deacetylase [Corynebacterium occultum]|uniref:1D-myo-inositol 2-acetamido-2-deoxy-alpha-D-glucopyranoside deacetylase n=1 Tax=Corynebacterium occultum TaxID=2675219 RepID=A0A6B8WAK1_9CORY|nr:PIG-L deacetylase family protein [Corynebacterium occultum]QGU08315.1 1D-myo-inositol 2-acetamido-2-deoxy-alpha-D-glucopyranoside deacetylase [Corynebacterium occultum]